MPTRLQTLRNRRERLIELNYINHYTQSSHPKTAKYYRCIFATKKEINDIECVNVRPIKKVGMTVFELRRTQNQ